jgi:hypothetical protein
MIGVVRTVALMPREEGIRGLQHDVLAVVCLPVHLRLLALAAHLEEPGQLPTRKEINRQHKKMILLRHCHRLMLAMYMLVHGEDLERTTPIALRHPLTQGEINFSGPRHNK